MLNHCPDDPTALDALVDGELPAPERDALERHLASCPRCRRELEALLVLRTLVTSSAAESPVPPELVARVRRDLDQARALAAPPSARPWRPRALQAALVLAGLSLGFAAGRWSISPEPPPLHVAARAPEARPRALVYPDENRIELRSSLRAFDPDRIQAGEDSHE